VSQPETGFYWGISKISNESESTKDTYKLWACQGSDEVYFGVIRQFRHLRLECEHSTRCELFRDPEHLLDCEHPFVEPRKYTPYCNKMSDQEHLKSFSHLCPLGTQCPDIDKSDHVQHWIHIVQQLILEDLAHNLLMNTIFNATLTKDTQTSASMSWRASLC